MSETRILCTDCNNPRVYCTCVRSAKAGMYFMHPEHGAVKTEYDSHFGAVRVRLLRMYAWKYVMVRDLTPTTLKEIENTTPA